MVKAPSWVNVFRGETPFGGTGSQTIYLSTYLSIYLPIAIYLSTYLSIYPPNPDSSHDVAEKTELNEDIPAPDSTGLRGLEAWEGP